MSNQLPEVIFKVDEYLDYETENKGYRNDVFVKLPNGDLIEVFFYDPVRLSQDMSDSIYITKPGLIVLKLVNKLNIRAAVNDLFKKGFFEYFTPRESPESLHFGENI